jgi:hypothetical protein
MLNHFGFGGLVVWWFFLTDDFLSKSSEDGFFLTDDFRSKSSRNGLLSNDKCQFSLGAANQLVVVGGGYL